MTATLPETVAPPAGLVTATEGGTVSALFDTVTRMLLLVMFPAASRARAVSVCEPLAAAIVFHDTV